MTTLLDDHEQSQGNCGVWNNFSLPEFTNKGSVFRGLKHRRET